MIPVPPAMLIIIGLLTLTTLIGIGIVVYLAFS